MSGQQTPVPQNLEAEESVLGAIMLNVPAAIDAVAEELVASDFYRESHGTIYTAALGLHVKGEPVDSITVVNALEETGDLETVGGRGRVHELAALVPATANVAHYARIVREMSTLRSMIRVSMEIGRLAWERPGEVPVLVEQAQELVFDLARDRNRAEVPLIREGLHAAYDRLVALHESGRDVIGVPTGLRELDLKTSGFHPGNLIVLAARPSMGKSALGIGIAAHVVLQAELPVAMFTLEMSQDEVVQRLLSLDAHVELHKLRTGRLNQDEWVRTHRAVSRLENARLFVDDDGAATLLDIRARARRLKLQNPDLALIVVDYLQLMGADAENRVQEVSKISRGLKVLARELEVPVLAISQLSRAPEQRHDKRPILSDLRESGSVEQDADLVMFVYRDEYYNPEDPEVEGLAELSVAKHRNGPTGTVKLHFVKRFARFSDPPLPGTGPGPT